MEKFLAIKYSVFAPVRVLWRTLSRWVAVGIAPCVLNTTTGDGCGTTFPDDTDDTQLYDGYERQPSR